ncbi:MAG: RagB/SusD family nutrient uptake outer membrane protein [Cyclobacteriaceae bacterium]|nr:RagB/SusD family nutrient uptake outer membrane protein [Cyclobacteriaceae bacterium]MCH8516778.1 RagB/SusD family nutrient uptake outer membrane protein [Cyclobacteriaceae bacterium]
MNIKNTLYTSLLLALLVFIASCADSLDLEPPQEISEEIALNSSANVELVLIGAYTRLGHPDLYGGYAQMDWELTAADGNIQWDGTFNDPREFFIKQILPQNSSVQGQWRRAYEVINITNNILTDGLEVINPDVSDRVEGEAKFLRGLCYFDLARSFSQPWVSGQNTAQNSSVPLITEPTRGVGEQLNVERNTTEDVYQQVIQDLIDARDLLPATNGFYAGSLAASAILSRVYLEREEWTLAAQEANRVIESGAFALAANYASIFNNASSGGLTSSEDIFSIQVTTQQGSNLMTTFFASLPEGGRGDIFIRDPFLNLFEEEDVRFQFFYEDDGVTWTGKWTNTVAANVNMIRISEMYLTRAEANLQAGTSVGATPLEDINTLRAIRNASEFTEITAEDIWLERDLELCFEGHRLFDFKRTRRSIGDIPFNANRLVYPIPFREMQTNPSLVQNPGYN